MIRQSSLGETAGNEIADLLLAYLELYPKAKDTIEGITNFWLVGSTAVFTREAVELVLEVLVERGSLDRSLKSDGEWLYHRSA